MARFPPFYVLICYTVGMAENLQKQERGLLLLFVKKVKVQCKMTGRPSDVVTKIRPQTFYPYSVRGILRAHERASARTSAKWSKRTINSPLAPRALTRKKEGM